VHTPLFPFGKPVGIFSTHYRKPHRPHERVLKLLDRLARRGADVIERAQMEASLYESEERFRALVTASSDVVYRTSAGWTEMHYLCGNYDRTRGLGPYEYRPTGTILPSAASIAQGQKP
jgi:hypothetical protein